MRQTLRASLGVRALLSSAGASPSTAGSSSGLGETGTTRYTRQALASGAGGPRASQFAGHSTG